MAPQNQSDVREVSEYRHVRDRICRPGSAAFRRPGGVAAGDELVVPLPPELAALVPNPVLEPLRALVERLSMVRPRLTSALSMPSVVLISDRAEA